ncbi:MAG: SurA N-terminal domain-containing protein [Ruminococcus sp.]|nr:SurA N-terminal domain-containing protein [Ruminococcus sp.]
MLKKTLAAVLAVIISVCALASCADKDSSSSNSSSKASSSSSGASSSAAEIQGPGAADTTDTSTEEVPDPALVIDGENVDITDLTICTIDGNDIDFDTFRYYYYYTLAKYTSTYGATMDTIKDTEGGFDLFLTDVITAIKQEYVAPALAKENGLELTDDEKQEIQEQIEQAKTEAGGEETFNEQLKSYYLTPELFETMLTNATIYQKVYDNLFTHEGIYATSQEDFRKIVQDPEQYCREIHIMIPYYAQVELDDSTASTYDSLSLSEKIYAKQAAYYQLDSDAIQQAKEKSKELAESLLKEAQETEDFGKLVEREGYDIGLEDSTNGYYFTPDSTGYPTSLIEAAFALDENEISSDLVADETYGYFIIKRLPIDMDYVENNIESMIESYDAPNFEKIYQDYMSKMKVTYFDQWDKLTADSVS